MFHTDLEIGQTKIFISQIDRDPQLLFSSNNFLTKHISIVLIQIHMGLSYDDTNY